MAENSMLKLLLAAAFGLACCGCSFNVSDDDDDDDVVVADDDDDSLDPPINDDDDDDNDDAAPCPPVGYPGCGALFETLPVDFRPTAVDYEMFCPGQAADALAIERQMWEMINVDRAEHAEEANGACPLQYDCAAADLARLHSLDMCMWNQLYSDIKEIAAPPYTAEQERDNPIGRNEYYRNLIFLVDYWLLGENVAIFDDLQGMEDKLVEEEPACVPNHRYNVLNYNFSHVGVGYCDCEMFIFSPGGQLEDSDASFLITQDFLTYDSNLLHADGEGNIIENPYCEAIGGAAR